MTLEAWYTLGVIGAVIAVLIAHKMSIDVAMMGGLTMLLLGDVFLPGDILSVSHAIEGFSHRAIILIAALFVVAAGMQETGGMALIAQPLLGRPKTIAGAQLRLMGPVAIMSAFMNNTPIVAMYLPIVSDWAKKLRISTSKLYLPLSFASILGGRITYIGTASNIVVMGLFLQYFSDPKNASIVEGIKELSAGEQFWGIAWIGIPTTLVGLAYLILVSRWLLPERKPADENSLDARKYQTEMIVLPDSPIVGKTIEEAGLRHLPGLFLTQIERQGRTRTAVSPEERLQPNDRLAFAGILESVIDLRKIRGLIPATDQVAKVGAPRSSRILVEAVIARNSPLVGQTVRAAQFRTVYNAAIIAVHRNGQQIKKKVGDIMLQPGDTLLLETHTDFAKAYRNSDDFYLVSTVEDSRPIRHERAGIAIGILTLLIILFTLTDIPQVISAFLCAALMIGSRCVTGTIARSSINWQILIVIAAALGMGRALETTGAAEHIAHQVTDLGHYLSLGPHGMLFIVFILAAGFAQLINTSGAAVLMFPITMNIAAELEVSPVPFAFVLMAAASASFISPMSYQTNLMVYGPGGYRFTDFVKIGFPLTVLLAILAVVIAPLVFPL